MHVARAGAALILMAAALAVPAVAHAETSSGTGQAGLSAAASVNFKMVIPPVLGLNVALDATAQPALAPEPTSTVVRGARGGMVLPTQSNVTLRSNMRQVTFVQQPGARPTYTVIVP
jgi:hypothetical protein